MSRACWLCKIGRDDARHLFSECNAVAIGKTAFSEAIQYDLGFVGLGARDELHGAYLVFNGTQKEAQVAAITIFNWAVFYSVRTWYECSPAESVHEAAEAIESVALRVWAKTRLEKWKVPTRGAKGAAVKSLGSAGKRSKAQREEARRRAIVAVNKAKEENAIVVFTDGSAMPNPGPAGAGVYILTSSAAAPTIECFAAIGEATNNIGELWAIGLALEIISSILGDEVCLQNSHIVIFTDSKWAKAIVECKAAAADHLTLVHAVRNRVLTTEQTRRVVIEWVGGHIDLEGNDFADFFANKGAKCSAEGLGMNDFLDHLDDFGLRSCEFGVKCNILRE